MASNQMSKSFTTHDFYTQSREKALDGPNGWLLFVSCNSGIKLAHDIRNEYEALHLENNSSPISVPLIGTYEEPLTRVFTDGESCPRLPIHVAGANAYVFQSTHEYITPNTVSDNIQQLIQVIRTLRSHRAKTITVVLPYSPYSRQDKPSFMKRESALASLFADQLKVAGADLYLTYHPHTLSLYGFYEPDIKFVALSGLDLFEQTFTEFKNSDDTIVVSTDAGGAKATVHFADKMELPYAISSKFRQTNGKASLIGVIGEIKDKKRAIIIDDETVTGNSIVNAVKTLHTKYGIEECFVGVSHFKIRDEEVKKFIEANEKYGLKEVHITNTVPQKKAILDLDFIVQHDLSSIFATTINKLHYNMSVSLTFSRL
ncbi:MAG: ribose-phosphate diphosphokinase [Bacteroidota bacterium]